MKEFFNEITHLEPLDIFYVGDRHKTYFEYPAHCHEVFELNFVAIRHFLCRRPSQDLL